MLAFAFGDNRCQHHDPFVFGQRKCLIHHLTDGLGIQRQVVVGAARLADAGEQQAQVVVDLGDGPDGRAGVVRGRFLFDRDRR